MTTFTRKHTVTDEDGLPDMPVKYRDNKAFRPHRAVLRVSTSPRGTKWNVTIQGPVVTSKGNLHASQEGEQTFHNWDSSLPGSGEGLLPDGRHVLSLFSREDMEYLGSLMIQEMRDITQANEDIWGLWTDNQ